MGSDSGLTRRNVILLAAVIWVFIKLPQEYWIHIAQLDTTDLIGADPGSGFSAAVVILVLVVVLRRVVWPRMPQPTTRGASLPTRFRLRSTTPAQRDAWIAQHRRLFDWTFLEKVVLVGFVCVIFAQILPDVDASSVGILIGTAILFTIDSLLGLWTARRSRGVTSLIKSFVWLALANVAVVLLGAAFERGGRAAPRQHALLRSRCSRSSSPSTTALSHCTACASRTWDGRG